MLNFVKIQKKKLTPTTLLLELLVISETEKSDLGILVYGNTVCLLQQWRLGSPQMRRAEGGRFAGCFSLPKQSLESMLVSLFTPR